MNNAMVKGSVKRIPPWTVLAELRKQAGMTQAELCAGIISQTRLSQIERGERLPDWSILERFSQRLRISFLEIERDWAALFEQTDVLQQLWRFCFQIESVHQQYSERTRLQNGLSDYLNSLTEPLLDDFCRLSYNGYLCALENENKRAERSLLQAWDGFPCTVLSDLDLGRLNTVHALTRIRISHNLGRTESAEFWKSRVPILFRYPG